MPADPEMVILHTVSALFDDDAADDLRSRLETRLPDVAVAHATTPRESVSMAPSAETVLTALPAPEVLDAAPNLQWMQALNAGVARYDHDRLREAGVVFTNASSVGAEPIAEQVLGYMLAFERGIVEGMRQQADGVWQRYTGGELRGKTVGVVGLGAIGGRVAELSGALGMNVIGTKRDLDSVPEAVDEVRPPDELHDVLTRSDYVVVACPLTEATRGLFGTDEFGVMKSDGVLVNVARGAVLDESALTGALQQGGIAGAALDVFEREPLPGDSPLWNLPNVVVTPHMAGYTPRYMERCADIVVENHRALTADEPDAMTNRIL